MAAVGPEQTRIVKRMLEYVKHQLNDMTSLEFQNAAESINLNYLFVCMNNTCDKTILKECIAIFNKVFAVLLPKFVFNKYPEQFVQLLGHSEFIVQSTIVANIEKLLIIDNDIGLQLDLVFALLDCLLSANQVLVGKISQCLMKFQSAQILTSAPIISKLRNMTGRSTDICPRLGVYTVLIDWSKSKDMLSIISAEGLLSSFIFDIKHENVMMRVGLINALKSMVETDHGLNFLTKLGVISDLYELLSTPEQQSMEPLILSDVYPAVMELFSDIALIKPQIIYTVYPIFFVAIYKIINDQGSQLVEAALNVVDKLASSRNCKIALDIPAPQIMIQEYKGKGESDIWSLLMEKLNNIACGNTINNREKSIKVITKILTTENGDSSCMLKRTKKWYKQLSSNPMENLVYRACSLRLLKIQIVGFEMLLKISEQPWGQEEINKYPSIMDLVFVLPHKDEAIELENLREKIVETLFHSRTPRVILDRKLLVRIHNFYYTLKEQSTNININLPDFCNLSI